MLEKHMCGSELKTKITQLGSCHLIRCGLQRIPVCEYCPIFCSVLYGVSEKQKGRGGNCTPLVHIFSPFSSITHPFSSSWTVLYSVSVATKVVHLVAPARLSMQLMVQAP